MRLRPLILTLLPMAALLLAAMAASGERVVLHSGRTLEGSCRLTDTRVIVTGRSRTSYVARASVERIELLEAEEQEFDRLRERYERGGAEGQFRMGQWMDTHLQFARADAFYGKAIELDPDHAKARKILGFRKVRGEWEAVPEDQLERAAIGLGGTAAEASVKLARIYAESGKDALAEKALRRALISEPSNQEALTAIQPYLEKLKVKRVYAPPLEGRTLAVSLHNHRLVAYMYNALDMVKIDEDGHPFHDDATKLENHYTYEAPVMAAADGKVIAVKDDFPDMPIGSPGDFLQANSVAIMHSNGLYSLYAHLKRGSVTVKPGDYVKAAQVIARAGNSGSTMQPHLHFCIYDSDGISLPFTFEAEAGK